ncbi:hypothetical protein [Caudoviricetes sp.]|nr:hypothetical protein [Caudoviricetes sp.]
MSMDFTFKPEGGQTISASTTSARNATAFTRDEVSMYSPTEGFYVKFGGSSVEATTAAGGYDRFCASGQYHELNTGGNQYVAVILASGTDTIHVNQWTKKR